MTPIGWAGDGTATPAWLNGTVIQYEVDVAPNDKLLISNTGWKEAEWGICRIKNGVYYDSSEVFSTAADALRSTQG